MLTRHDIEHLISFHNPDFPVVSFYFNVEKGESGEGKYTTRFKNLLAQVEEDKSQWSKPQMDSLGRDLDRIKAFVRDQQVRGGRGLIAFACSAAGLWQTYSFQQSVGDHLIVEHEPYLKPLFRLLGHYDRYCTVLVGKGRARIFLLYLNEIEERSDIVSTVPKRHDQGGWAQARLQRHHDEQVGHHLQTTAAQVFALFQEQEFSKLLVGSTEELASQFHEHLHPYLKERQVATFPLGMTASARTVKERSLAVLHQVEEEEKSRLLDRLESEAGAQKQGIVGLDGTLRALQRGQVLTLLVNEDFAAPGNRCRHCGHLTVRAAEECPYCGSGLQPLDDVVDEVVEAAFRQDCQVKFVTGRSSKRLAKLGGIGALLRYTPSRS
jgi:peptide chain release factor subunit 1